MTPEKPRGPLFRPEALRRYSEQRQQAVLPQFIAPRTLRSLWVLLGVILGAGVVGLFAPVPIYTAGTGVVVYGPGEVRLVVFLPAAALARLHPGQAVSWPGGPGGARQQGRVMAVEPAILSPAEAQRRFNLSPSAAGAVTALAAVVSVAWTAPDPALPAATYAGSRYPVDVETGSAPLLRWLPGMDTWQP
jgi:hypothetical protein